MSMGCLIRPAMVGKCEISYHMANSIWRWELYCMVVVESNAEARCRGRSRVGLGLGGCWKLSSVQYN